MRVSKWWQNFHFWVNYPFNHLFTNSLTKEAVKFSAIFQRVLDVVQSNTMTVTLKCDSEEWRSSGRLLLQHTRALSSLSPLSNPPDNK